MFFDVIYFFFFDKRVGIFAKFKICDNMNDASGTSIIYGQIFHFYVKTIYLRSGNIRKFINNALPYL